MRGTVDDLIIKSGVHDPCFDLKNTKIKRGVMPRSIKSDQILVVYDKSLWPEPMADLANKIDYPRKGFLNCRVH